MNAKRIYTTQIKQNNINLVKAALRTAGTGTKLSVSAETGLSVSTCNTLLNQLLADDELIEVPIPYNHIGRPSKAYAINPDYEHCGCILLIEKKPGRTVRGGTFNLHGEQLSNYSYETEKTDQIYVESIIQSMLEQDPRITTLSLGVPGIVSKTGKIYSCDIREIENWNAAAELEKKFPCRFLVENDMNAIAYGLREQSGEEESPSIAVINLAEHVCPGCGILVDGVVVRGKTNFAGEVSYLFPKDRRSQEIESLSDERERLHAVVKLLLPVITVVNPSRMYLMGNLVSQELPEKVKEYCLQYIDAVHLPDFLLLQDSDGFYMHGLWSLAIGEK